MCAIKEICESFVGHIVDAADDGQGGARVVVQQLDLSEKYKPRYSWVGFVIGFAYPASDVYPHYLVPELARADGTGLGAGFGTVNWNGQQATQVSRRSYHWNAEVDTAAQKLQKVLAWIRSR